jgi:ribulose-phosphate 3-epimerase
LSLIRSGGARAGVALNPATPLEAIRYVLDRLDFVLIMTVNPGFAGQKMVPSGFDKIADCAAFLKQHGRADIQIQVDGNVSFENIPGMVKAGARNLVAGTSSIFNSRGSVATNAAQTREAIAAGLVPARSRAKTTKRKR